MLEIKRNKMYKIRQNKKIKIKYAYKLNKVSNTFIINIFDMGLNICVSINIVKISKGNNYYTANTMMAYLNIISHVIYYILS